MVALWYSPKPGMIGDRGGEADQKGLPKRVVGGFTVPAAAWQVSTAARGEFHHGTSWN